MFGCSIKKAHSALKSGSILPSELLENSLSKAEHLQPILNAATVILNDLAKKQAIDSDKRYKVGKPLSMIDGLPIVVKDNFCLAGAPTTCGSRARAAKESRRAKRLEERAATTLQVRLTARPLGKQITLYVEEEVPPEGDRPGANEGDMFPKPNAVTPKLEHEPTSK